MSAPEESRSILDDAAFRPFHVRLAVYSAGGPFLDGYILSIIGIALVQIGPQFQLSTTWQGLIGASALIGMLVGGVVFGYLTDRFGRQAMYTLDLLLIIASSVAQYFVEGAVALFVLRLVAGIAVGADYPIATSLLTEFMPRRQRGPMLGAMIAVWFFGAAVAYVVGIALQQVGPDAWRWLLLSPAVPAAVIVLMRIGTPESPRWLLKHGRPDQALRVLRKVFGPDAQLTDLAEEPARLPARALFRSGYLGRLVFVIAFWACSIIPLFAIYAFGPALFAALHLDGDLSNIGEASINVLFLLGTILGLAVINVIGRRKLLIWSFVLTGFPLLYLGIYPESGPAGVLIAFATYALFLGGSQILQFVYPNELFPTEIRASAVGIATGLSRVAAAVGTFLVPISLSNLGVGPTVLAAAVITLVGLGVTLAFAPETRGLDLHESAALHRRRPGAPRRPQTDAPAGSRAAEGGEEPERSAAGSPS